MQPFPEGERHQLMIGGMEFDGVEREALRGEAAQLGRVLIGEPPLLQHMRAPGLGAEPRQIARRPARTFPRDRFAQGRVRRKKVDVLEHRALVEHLVRGQRVGQWIGIAVLSEHEMRLLPENYAACRPFFPSL